VRRRSDSAINCAREQGRTITQLRLSWRIPKDPNTACRVSDGQGCAGHSVLPTKGRRPLIELMVEDDLDRLARFVLHLKCRPEKVGGLLNFSNEAPMSFGHKAAIVVGISVIQ